MKKIKKIVLGVTLVLIILFSLACNNQASRVSHNLSKEADNFNVVRQITVINTRAEESKEAILFQMTGNFSINTSHSTGELQIIGEDEDGRFYKHFVYLSRDIVYIVEDLESTSVGKYKFTVYYNPEMIIPIDFARID